MLSTSSANECFDPEQFLSSAIDLIDWPDAQAAAWQFLKVTWLRDR